MEVRRGPRGWDGRRIGKGGAEVVVVGGKSSEQQWHIQGRLTYRANISSIVNSLPQPHSRLCRLTAARIRIAGGSIPLLTGSYGQVNTN